MSTMENEGGTRPSGTAPFKGTVKWFNPAKGFGFVTLEDGQDAFCHASALVNLQSPSLPQGATIMCEVQQGQRGLQIINVHSIDLSTAEAQPMRGPRPPRDHGHAGPSGPMADGKVKFFNEQKGFGFVVPGDGSTDVYIHASALRRSGIPTLATDQRIRFSTRQGMKGIEVDRIEAI
jgi:CspA family cold shock protein